MTPGVISFTCSSCGVRLTVPESMAGISGPCPRCSATIQAPPAAGLPTLKTAIEDPKPQRLTPPAPAPPALSPEAPATSSESDATTILPEPRAKPERRATKGTKGIDARKSTSDETLRRRHSVPREAHAPSKSSPRITRILLPLFFVVAGGAIVFMLLYFFLPGGPAESLRRSSIPPTDSPPKNRPIYPESATSTLGRPNTSTLPAGPVEDAPPLSTDGLEGINAGDVLERFLSASSLDERLVLIDRADLREALKDTILDESLPEVMTISSETPVFNSVEKFTDYPFRVAFQGGEGSLVEYTILVRKREDLGPKVVVAPFLDLVGGRLAKFAATPVEGPRTFHAIIEAMPRCFEEGIPNPEKKFTYKLSACDVGRTTARAYASLTSSLAEQLYSADFPIRWGKRIRATVILEWNTSEDPSQPYIELLDIKSLDWNS